MKLLDYADWRPPEQDRGLADVETIKLPVSTLSGSRGIPSVLLVLIACTFGTPIYTVFMLSRATNISLQEGQYGVMCDSTKKSIDEFIYQHYNSGLILNDVTTLDLETGTANIDFKNVVYQGSDWHAKYWTRALAHPEQVVQWVVINPSNLRDLVARHINVRSVSFNADFELVAMQSNGAMLFHLRGLPPLPNRAPMPQYRYPHYPC